MKEDFNYNEVPKNFLHCLHAQCPRSADCLHFQVALHADSTIIFFPVLNPNSIAGKEDACPYYQPNCLSRFAFGITHLYDNMPHTKAVRMKEILYCYLKKNTYYRIRNKERHITPKEQEFIRKAFQREGIKEEPVFDSYIDKYDW